MTSSFFLLFLGANGETSGKTPDLHAFHGADTHNIPPVWTFTEPVDVSLVLTEMLSSKQCFELSAFSHFRSFLQDMLTGMNN